MSGRESLDYLYGLQTFGIKLGLDNIRSLHARLGAPSDSYRTVLIAGTNGKGSTASTLAAILHQSGLRTGLYTSPHLHCFTERIRIDGVAVDFDELEPLIAELRELGHDLPLTFFEFTTALALETFRRHEVDIAVLEVGMGGRLDATNVVSPSLSIITPISFDHQAHLGATLEQIAQEKAGIMRPKVPVVLAEQPPVAQATLLAAAAAIGATPIVAGNDFSWQTDGSTMNYAGLDLHLEQLQPALAGNHQCANMAAALAAAEILRRQGLPVDAQAMADGVATVVWPGRLEWFGADRQLLLDGAHNGAGAIALAAYLEQSGIRRVRWVVGIKRDKEMAQILKPLLAFAVQLYCVAPPVEDALPPVELARSADAAAVPATAFTTVADALTAARADCAANEVVLVAGSLFLVAAVRDLLVQENQSVAS